MDENILEIISYTDFMKNLLKNIKYFMLSVQEKFLEKNLKPHMQKSFENSGSKTIISGGETVTLNSETEKKRQLVQQNISDITKSCANNPQKLLDYISAKGTKIYRIKNAVKILNRIGEEEGLITALRGKKAIYLNMLILKKFAISTEPMIVMGQGEIEPYYMIREFYKWYSMQMELPGFNFSAQENFKKYMKNPNDQNFKSMNYREMLELKEAIARDKEANEFVINLIKEKEGSENIFKKLNNGGGTI